MDVSYIPMARGFVYLRAVVDWFRRRVLAGRCRSPWMSRSASRRSKKRWLAMASLTSPTRIRSAVHQPEVHRSAYRRQRQDQHGRQRRLARQRLRLTPPAINES
ncbi:hypothetical protein AB4Z40_14130 [Bosea sp. 2YAB26]